MLKNILSFYVVDRSVCHHSQEKKNIFFTVSLEQIMYFQPPQIGPLFLQLKVGTMLLTATIVFH